MKGILRTACTAIVVLAAVSFSAHAQEPLEPLTPLDLTAPHRDRLVSIFGEVFELIDQAYLYDIDLEKCAYDILKALSGETLPHEDAQARDTSEDEFVCLDKFSGFMTPEESREAMSQLKGQFVGIGIRVFEKDGAVVVNSLLEDSPAKKAGMQQGDKIIRVRSMPGGELTDVESVEHAVELIKGSVGTTVDVTIERAGKHLVFAITREIVHTPSVESLRIAASIGYVRVISFTAHTGDEIEAALAAFEEDENPRVIIDLRDNPGGEKFGTIESAFLFSGNGQDIIITERFKNDEQIYSIDSLLSCVDKDFGEEHSCFINPETGEYKSPGRFAHYRIVILINGNTASASELFTGALQDWGKASKNFLVVGEKSFGKGVVQAVIPLQKSSGSKSGNAPVPALSLTTSEYLVGNIKTPVHGKGITPDFYVDDSRTEATSPETFLAYLAETLTERDMQFRAALRIWGIEETPAVREFLSRTHYNELGELVD